MTFVTPLFFCGCAAIYIDNSIENGFSHRAKTPPTQSRHALDFTVLN